MTAADRSEPWAELRVHGVSGTPPESILDFDRVEQVAGDEFGRFFRRVGEQGEELPGPAGQTVEAYHWGRFTSGTWAQALWLVLTPFGMVNAAQFMLDAPTSGAAKLWHAVAGAMLRLVGLALTALFVVTTTVVAVDLWAWQRTGPGGGFPLGVLLAARMLAPLGLLVGYLLLERIGAGGGGRRERPAPEDPTPLWQRELPSDLARPGFFAGDAGATALRRLHVAAGLAIVALLGFAPGVVAGSAVATWGYRTSAVGLAAIVVVVLFLGDPEQTAGVALRSGRLNRLKSGIHAGANAVATGFATLAALVAAGSIVLLAVTPPAPSVAVHYPGLDWASDVTMMAAVAALVVLVLANLLLVRAESTSPVRTGNDRFAPYAGGFGCTLMTAVGVFVGVGFSGAFSVLAARTLNTAARPVRVPELLSRVTYAWGVTAVVLAVIVVFALVRRSGSARRVAGRVRDDFTRDGVPRIPPRWVRRVSGAIWAARLKNVLPQVLIVFSVVGTVLSVGAVCELGPQFAAAPDRWPEINGAPVRLPGVLDWISQSDAYGNPVSDLLITLGTLTLTLLATALIALGRSALLGESTRRGINVVWDVIAFWPRSAHPFVPRAYSLRAVPDLQRRIAWYRTRSTPGAGGRTVLLCGHSQGSLLSFATLLRMSQEDGTLDDIGLLTFGSQLQVMFARAFPAYVNLPTIRYLYAALNGAWINFYRDTDPLAGPALSWRHRVDSSRRGRGTSPMAVRIHPEGRRQYGPDWCLLDPPVPPDADQQEGPLLPIRGHGDYWKDAAWPEALRRLRGTPPSTATPPAPADLCRPERGHARWCSLGRIVGGSAPERDAAQREDRDARHQGVDDQRAHDEEVDPGGGAGDEGQGQPEVGGDPQGAHRGAGH